LDTFHPKLKNKKLNNHMKLKLFTFALLALLVAGCTDNINLPEPDENDRK